MPVSDLAARAKEAWHERRKQALRFSEKRTLRSSEENLARASMLPTQKRKIQIGLFGLKYYSTLFNCGQLTSPLGSNILMPLYDRDVLKELKRKGLSRSSVKELTCIGGVIELIL
ncbi:hypothetical protein HYC85_016771 [Camellia sinensis]|uniref:Uncharacterized protein n=1 Tax=Camellia sinensis TaxID=4442 RepID=A0A7J7H0K9_CAMSI|nr:hypothetical protein HYC85_016771 [Camellia sinensis]